jgi:DNA replication and repair protein RecF
VPVVIVSPADSSLISDSADERRRFVNGFISQLDKSYLDAVMRYNTALANRNSYLKIGSDEEMLCIYDAQMAPLAEKIHQARVEITELLYPLVCEYYLALSDDHEQVELLYRSELNDHSLEELLLSSRERDRVMGYTNCGVQRDDLRFSIGGYPLRKYGSQGQQKSFLIALKLAQYRIIAQACGERPILLLDDLFDKLDESRVARLVELVKGEEFGQVIITDCNGERMGNILREADCSYKLFNVTYGEVVK